MSTAICSPMIILIILIILGGTLVWPPLYGVFT